MASEEITNETAEQPVEAATPAPVAETPAAAVSAKMCIRDSNFPGQRTVLFHGNRNRRNSFNGNFRKSGSVKKNGTPRNTNDSSELHHHASKENLDIGALQKMCIRDRLKTAER